MKAHPDKNKLTQATEAFQRLKDAWDVLSDDKQRKTYDQEGARAGLLGKHWQATFEINRSWMMMVCESNRTPLAYGTTSAFWSLLGHELLWITMNSYGITGFRSECM